MTSTIRKAMYLSGPMTGHPDWNYPAFHAAARMLRAWGHAVINPAESYNGDQSLSFDTYMRLDLKQILEACDTIVVLPGWEKSPGAVLEVAVAAALGHGVLSFIDRPELNGYALESTFEVHETNRERLVAALARFVYPVDVKSDGAARPATWVHFGEHVERNVPLEFSDEVGEDGLPLWERPKASGPEPLNTWAEADSKLLLEADRIVNSDRQRTYGHPITHHTATAAMWSAYLTRVNDEHDVIVRPQDVSILMVLDKASRIGGGDKVDNALDIAGYAQVHAKVRARQESSNGGVFE